MTVNNRGEKILERVISVDPRNSRTRTHGYHEFYVIYS